MTESFLEILQYGWALRALAASVVVGAICGILGCFIVLRNMSLVGDALSHSILPGVVVAFILFGYNPFGFFIGSVVAGLITAAFIIWIQQNVKTKNDAAIGIVFTAMFSVGVIGISKISKTGGVHLDLKDFLFGNILGVGVNDIYLSMGIGLFIILSVMIFYRHLFATSFQEVVAQTMGYRVDLIHYFLMLLLSFTVVASLQTVGVILVVAMLITPASTALLLSNNLKIVLFLSAIFGILSSVIGIILAIYFNTTPGPVIALVITSFYLLAVVFSPEKGVLIRQIQRRRQQLKVLKEDFLKLSYKLNEKGMYSKKVLIDQLDWSNYTFKKILSSLKREGLAKDDTENFPLTIKGEKMAKQMVRAHRLWETYLVTKMGMREDQIHEDAEKVEHFLTDDTIHEIDRSLGSPSRDPHGSEIPEHFMAGTTTTIQKLIKGKKFEILEKNSADVLQRLSEFNILAGKKFYLLDKSYTHYTLKSQDGQVLIVPKNLIRNLSVRI